ncbi:MAG: hypothetical protein ACM3PC_14715 [Deltaproteobacteria bacterium]
MLLALLAAVVFDLQPARVSQAEAEGCLVDETIPLGSGTAQKLSCPSRLDARTVQSRCKRDALPDDITVEQCPAEHARGHFLFRGELKELILARRKDGSRVAAFKVLEGDQLAAFQHFGEAVLVGIGAGSSYHYAVVSTRGVLKAPDLGEIRDVSVVGARLRITGKAGATLLDVVPDKRELRIVR